MNNDSFYDIENLIIESYNHITDIRGTRKNKNAKEIAELKEYKEIIALMEEYEQYKASIWIRKRLFMLTYLQSSFYIVIGFHS